MTEQQIIDAAYRNWPHAAEVHVQYHSHIVKNAFNTIREGVYICSIEGRKVRKQFTAKSSIDLYHKVSKNIADPGFKRDESPIAHAESTWEAERPGLPITEKE